MLLLILVVFFLQGCSKTSTDSSCVRYRKIDRVWMISISSDCYNDNETNRLTADEVDISSKFWMDEHEVTNAQYKICVDEQICTPPRNDNSDTESNYFSNPKYSDYPVVYVDWNQAQQYCQFAGGRLPSMDEWLMASGYGFAPDLYSYPWGSQTPNDQLGNFLGGKGATEEQGQYPEGQSPFGVKDMAGNVWEWIDHITGTEVDCCTLKRRKEIAEIRGGAWNESSIYLKNSESKTINIYTQSDNIGFRCVTDD